MNNNNNNMSKLIYDVKGKVGGVEKSYNEMSNDEETTLRKEIEELNSSLDSKKPKKSRRKISEKNVVNLSL